MNDDLGNELTFSHIEYICSLTYRISHLCEQKQNAILREYGLTHNQTQVLAYIYARSGQTVLQRDIEKALYLKSSSVTEQLNLLEKKGYVRRLPHQDDKRAKVLTVTEKARSMHQVFLSSLISVDETLTRGMTEEDIAQLRRLIMAIYSNIKTDRAE